MDKKKKTIRKYISWVVLVAVVALLAVMPALAKNAQPADEIQASILTDTVETATIRTQLLGGGKLAGQDPVEVTVPAAVKLTGYMVGNGDTVKQGDLIATVDRVTVMQAITEVQETMEYLQEEIEEISDEEAPDEVTAQAAGTVKEVYAAPGDDARDVMLEHGALAVLSLDGCMAVQIPCQTSLGVGDDVPVKLPDGTEVTGQVETNRDGVLTVLIEDEDYAIGTQVTVENLGTGSLYIHAPWNAIAYSGSITAVRVEAGDSVSEGKVLFRLEDTGHTAQFYGLSAQHREYEELMLELFSMYQTQCLTAPTDGVITGVDPEAYLLSAVGEYSIKLLANAPNGDDESSYINYVGVVTAAGIDGLAVNINPQVLQITDYKDLSGLPLDPALMTESVVYAAGAPVYELQSDAWVQIDAATIAAGDILLFAGDMQGNFVWLVRVSTAAPEVPETPEMPTDPVFPDISYPDISYPSIDISGLYGGYGYALPEFETYSMDTVTVASVTSQQEMLLLITVDETDISFVQVGQLADVTVDALTGEKFTALVTEVASTGENSGGNSKFTVELTLQKSGDMLPGMTASAFFHLSDVENVPCIPVAALTEQGTQTLVYTGYDPEEEVLTDPVAVTTGTSDGEMVQILSGLEVGETFYYAYYDTLVISNIPDLNDYDFF